MTKTAKMKGGTMRNLVLAAALATTTGCASEDWTRADTYAELAWQTLNIVDAGQTANIRHIPEVYEGDPLTRAVLGSQPAAADTYQLMATYAISHYVISRTLAPRWRQYWHGMMLVPKGIDVLNNEELGL